MPGQITIGGSSPLFDFTSVSSLDWSIVPPKLFFFWTQGNSFPPPFVQDLRFPAYDLLPRYQDYTDFQFETEVVSPGSIPFFLVDGFKNATSDLGTLDVDFYEKQLTLSFQLLSLISAGDYPVYFLCKITAIHPDTLLRVQVAGKIVNVSVNIKNVTPAYLPLVATYVGDETDPVTGFRKPLIFNYRLGGNLPTPQTVYCFPGYADTVASSADLVLNYSVANASMGELSVGFTDLSSLPIGQYEYYIFIEKASGTNISSVRLRVLLNVLESKPDGFNIDPNSLNFDVVVGDVLPNHQSVNVASNTNWSIVGAVPDWLYISQFSGFGNDDVLFVPHNFEEYEDGVYFANVVFDSATVQIPLPVTMTISSAVRNPFTSDKLYFTKDEDYLYFKSKTTDSYFEITLQVRVFKINTNEFRDYERLYKLPLFQGRADFHVGTIVHQLLNEMNSLSEQVPSVDSNYTKSQYQPAQVLIKYEEKSYTSSRVVNDKLIKGQTDLFQMIKGVSPYVTKSKLSLLTVGQQEFTRLTPNSVLGISFTFPGTPYLIVKRNTVTIDELFLTPFSAAESEKIIYSYYRFLNDFDPGDVIEISLINDFETRTQRFIVMDAGPESTFILFENQNGLVEPFEFSGRRRVSSNIEHLLAEKLVKLNATTKKIEASNSQSLIVNTGQLSKPDHKIITAIVKSENVWVSFDTPFGPYFKIDATTTKFVNQDTASNEDEFDIEFNILEDTDATIYPQ